MNNPALTVSFLAHLYKSIGTSCCHPDLGIAISMGLGIGVTLYSSATKFIYVMGRVLSGKLSFMQTSLVIHSYENLVIKLLSLNLDILLPLFKKGSCQLLAKVCALSTG